MKDPFEHRRRIGAGLVIATQALLGVGVMALGPTHPMPMHFGLDGHVDRWGGRTEAGGVILFMALLSTIMTLALEWTSKRLTSLLERQRGLFFAQIIILAVTSMICLLMLSLACGLVPDGGGDIMGMLFLCALFTLIGAYLGKVSPNPMVGVRTPWTYASRLAWEKSNRLAGRLFFWGGLAGLAATPLAPQPEGMEATIACVLAFAILCVFESWRVWRTDPDRRQGYWD